MVFHSPAFDYSADVNAALLPTAAMTTDYLKITSARGTSTLEEYAQVLREVMKKRLDIDTSKYTGPWDGGRSLYELNKNVAFNHYDTRMYVSAVWKWGRGVFLHYSEPWYDFNLFEERALYNMITNYLPGHVNYKSPDAYITASWKDWFHPGEGAFEGWDGSAELKNGLPDIVETLIMDPSLKLLTVHGYYDMMTPFYSTELSLKGIEIDPVKKTTLLDRIPVKNFEGGHMMYYSEKARAPLKKTLDDFYDAPPYGTGPTVANARDLAASAPAQRAPVPAVALH